MTTVALVLRPWQCGVCNYLVLFQGVDHGRMTEALLLYAKEHVAAL
jgi:hypothetical protein